MRGEDDYSFSARNQVTRGDALWHADAQESPNLVHPWLCSYYNMNTFTTCRSTCMPLSKEPSSLLEAQNRRLIKMAGEKAAQVEKLERELLRLQERATQSDRLELELHGLQAQADKLER